MNYFDQITNGSKDNIISLLKFDSNIDDITKKSIFKRNVEIINLELSYLCNRACDYCPVSTSTRRVEQKFITPFLLEKICNELESIRYENRISLNLYNEPLLDNLLEEKISLIRQKLPYSHIAFNSNGDKLTLNRLRSLSDAGCNYICVTLHPLPQEEQGTTSTLKRLRKLYKKLKQEDLPELDINTQKYIQFRSLGVNIKVQWPDWRLDGSNRAGSLVSHISKSRITQRYQPCAKPFREFTIYYDGKVQPCCEVFHDDAKNILEVGNLNNSSIFQVYTSELLSNFRCEVFDFSPKKGIYKNCNILDYSRPEEDPLRKYFLSKVKSC